MPSEFSTQDFDHAPAEQAPAEEGLPVIPATAAAIAAPLKAERDTDDKIPTEDQPD